ncbi:MAG TPA: hypothetical protein DIC42_06425 [Holosporales bacterium]|nr:hypothetical protein [Holosporales bacterium]
MRENSVLKLILILGIFLNSFPKCAENSDSNSNAVPSTALSNVQLSSQKPQIMLPFPDWFCRYFSIQTFNFVPFSSGMYAKFLSGPYAFMHLVGTVW